MRSICNVSAFQGGWFARVLGGAHHVSWLGVIAVTTLVVLNANLAMRPGEALKLIGFADLNGVELVNPVAELTMTAFAQRFDEDEIDADSGQIVASRV